MYTRVFWLKGNALTRVLICAVTAVPLPSWLNLGIMLLSPHGAAALGSGRREGSGDPAVQEKQFQEFGSTSSALQKLWQDPARLTALLLVALLYIVAIIPTSLPNALVPALEKDPHLIWDKGHTAFFLSSSVLSEAFGNILLGHIGDSLGGINTICLATAVMGVLLHVFALARPAVFMLITFTLIGFVKGTTWPAVGQLLGSLLGREGRWEFGILSIGIASRFGDTCSKHLLGLLLREMEWPQAVALIAALLLVLAISFRFIFEYLDPVRLGIETPDGESPCRDDERTRASRTGGQDGDFLSRCWGVLCERDVRVMMSITSGLRVSWAVGDLEAVTESAVFKTSPASAAMLAGSYPFGMFLSLIASLTLVVCFEGGGHERYRLYQVAFGDGLRKPCCPDVSIFLPLNSTWRSSTRSSMFPIQCSRHVPPALRGVVDVRHELRDARNEWKKSAQNDLRDAQNEYRLNSFRVFLKSFRACLNWFCVFLSSFHAFLDSFHESFNSSRGSLNLFQAFLAS